MVKLQGARRQLKPQGGRQGKAKAHSNRQNRPHHQNRKPHHQNKNSKKHNHRHGGKKIAKHNRTQRNVQTEE